MVLWGCVMNTHFSTRTQLRWMEWNVWGVFRGGGNWDETGYSLWQEFQVLQVAPFSIALGGNSLIFFQQPFDCLFYVKHPKILSRQWGNKADKLAPKDIKFHANLCKYGLSFSTDGIFPDDPRPLPSVPISNIH